MKKIVAVIFTIICAPFILMLGVGSMSLAANTGDLSGLLFTGLLILLLGIIWRSALRQVRPNDGILYKGLPWWVMALFLVGVVMYVRWFFVTFA